MTKAFSLDMETLSLEDNPLILSIGVVLFDTDKVQSYKELYNDSPTLHLHLFQKDQVERYGRHKCQETANWWANQTERAQQSVFSAQNSQEFSVAIQALRYWLGGYMTQTGASQLWSYGSASDAVWIKSAFKAINEPFPFHYRNIRCLRTWAAELGVGCPVSPLSIKHNALCDALIQAMWVQQCNKKVSNWRKHGQETIPQAA